MQIVNEKGERLYFTEDQRKALLTAAAKAPREVRSFCSVLCSTGCRISEALALTPKSIDLSAKVLSLRASRSVSRASTDRFLSRQSCSTPWTWFTASVSGRRKVEPDSMSVSGRGVV